MRWLTLVVSAESERRYEELVALLGDLPVELVRPEHVLGAAVPSLEDADGFEATATHRARELSRATGLVTIAEASGLEVEALGGRPGLRSNHFAHERATDAENNAALLAALEDIDDEERTARFRCVLAAASPWSTDIILTSGSVDGCIARTPRGSGGFSYEPLFIVSRVEGRAFAELTDAERRELSPHAQATRGLAPRLMGLLNDLLDATERIAG